MAYVNWQYIVLDHGTFSGYRVARRRTQAFVPDAQGQDQTVGTPPGWNAHAPATLQHQGDTYNFAFWFLAGGLFGGQPLTPRVIPTPNFYDVVGEDSGTVATAYYMWNFGTDGGDNGAYLDAFDLDRRDFMAEDFVDVAPDDAVGTLTAAANNGLLDTTADVKMTETITARGIDKMVAYEFVFWQGVSSLAFAGTQAGLPAIMGRDITVNTNDIVVAIAFYREPPHPLPRIPNEWIYDPWWWVKTHGGLTPPWPPDPFGPWGRMVRQVASALALPETLGTLSSRDQVGLLEATLRQLSIAAGSIEKAIKKLQNE